jgi:uncharacterized protein (TIGR03086 family)
MSTDDMKRAIQSTRGVLTHVDSSQLGDSTPCAKWDVAGLINHIIGSQLFCASAFNGESSDGDAPDFSAGDFMASFDEASTSCVEAIRVPGATERTLTLPFGSMPAAAFLGLATSDVFVHGWDLAKATGQSTDLDPELASRLLEQARAAVSDAMRNSEGNPFGPEVAAPEGAGAADQLAAFYGRRL